MPFRADQLAAQALIVNSGVKEQLMKSLKTVEFIRIIDKIFDVLNTRKPFGKGYKATIRPSTLKCFEEIFSKASEYLRTLLVDGVSLISHNRRTFAIEVFF